MPSLRNSCLTHDFRRESGFFDTLRIKRETSWGFFAEFFEKM